MRHLALVALLTACSGASTPSADPASDPAADPAPDPVADVPFEPIEVPDGVADAVNGLAFDLYGELVDDKTENAFFSPVSIEIAMAMAAGGAKGDTLAEMEKSLRLDQTTHADLGTLVTAWNAAGERAPYKLAIANRMFVQNGASLVPSYETLTGETYGAPVESLDFTDTEPSRKRINDWTAEQTNDKIKDLLKTLDKRTRVVLVNAIYFKGDWKETFEESATKDAPFTKLDGTTVDVPLMHQTLDAWHYQGDGFSAVSLPYEGDDLDMLVVLPDDETGLRAVEAELSAAALSGWSGTGKEVRLWLPKFKADFSAQLVPTFQALGMKRPFQEGADFTGVSTEFPLQIGQIAHKAFVSVDEKGTEAAAATAVAFTSESEEPQRERVDFRADHPFFYAIRDRTTGTLLFVGRLVNPA